MLHPNFTDLRPWKVSKILIGKKSKNIWFGNWRITILKTKSFLGQRKI